MEDIEEEVSSDVEMVEVNKQEKAKNRYTSIFKDESDDDKSEPEYEESILMYPKEYVAKLNQEIDQRTACIRTLLEEKKAFERHTEEFSKEVFNDSILTDEHKCFFKQVNNRIQGFTDKIQSVVDYLEIRLAETTPQKQEAINTVQNIIEQFVFSESDD